MIHDNSCKVGWIQPTSINLWNWDIDVISIFSRFEPLVASFQHFIGLQFLVPLCYCSHLPNSSFPLANPTELTICCANLTFLNMRSLICTLIIISFVLHNHFALWVVLFKNMVDHSCRDCKDFPDSLKFRLIPLIIM